MGRQSSTDRGPGALRARWHELCREQSAQALRVHLLASYTIDPLVPYLGVGLHEARLPAAISAGPSNQIVQQLLDENSETIRAGPDVLVVAPRFEELAEQADAPGRAPAGWAHELSRLADTALAVADRHDFALVFVLPALPESRPYGVGDAGSPGGVVAAATLAREALRRRLAGRPNVWLADAEEALREVGSRQAHHPVLFRFAKVPYTEELFAAFGAQLSRLLRVRLGRACHVAVLDADSLVPATTADADACATIDVLRAPLLELSRAGVALGVRGGASATRAWSTLAAAFPELLGELLDRSSVDGRPLTEQLTRIASDAAVPVEQMVLVTADRAVAADIGGDGRAATAVVLPEQPEAWLAGLRTAGVFDRVPDVMTDDEHTIAGALAEPSEHSAAETATLTSLADFVGRLNVTVTYVTVQDDNIAKVVELVERAKDFTLGIQHSAADLAARSEDLIAVTVGDRFGDHGISAAVALRSVAGTATVDLFSISCAVLGRDVEQAILAELVERASAEGSDTIVFRLRPTAQNGIAMRFLDAAGERTWSSRSGAQVRIRTDRESER